MKRKAIVAGNWKMNASRQQTEKLVSTIAAGIEPGMPVEVVLCPPALYIDQVAALLGPGSGIAWGGQNLDYHDSGAFTGEISAAMLVDLGCKYVIAGHSERRSLFAESDDVVARKVAAAQEQGLFPILCVGESLEVRESGQTRAVVGSQLDAVLDRIGIAGFRDLVLAYEPIWAIGTGKTAKPEQAQEVHQFLRQRLAAHDAGIAAGVRILYGGSVKADNAAELFAKDDIDGGLIGGAALDAGGFLTICRSI